MGKGRHTSNGDLTQDASYRTQPVGIYGWRKRCLYAVILFLVVVTVINLALIVWILRVLNFSVHGMGKMRMTEDGMRLEGRGEFLDNLYVQELRSQSNKPLYVESSKDIIMRARDEELNISSVLTLGNKKIQAQCENFEVKDKYGTTRFQVSDKGVNIAVEEVYYTGTSKASFNASIETPTIRGPRTKPLSIEALSTSLLMYASDEVQINSKTGSIGLMAANEIALISKDIISLDSENIFLKNLPTSSVNSGQQSGRVYQLCMCHRTGRLFLAPPGGGCQASKDICR
ncbi:hypothetical protein FSP39_021347 [Pinctada imbricata]|uniref:Uncharacterized protein n=1 Tax=Pinctada imbricata TaxID=66713 RepID=A0AA88Y8D9_PINIB|nr:hypothetical protein FSP39_021347 [Pinctada imbricata]